MIVDVFEVIKGLLILRFGFRAEADNDVGRQHHVGPERANAAHEGAVFPAGIRATHQVQDPIASGLQREMDVFRNPGMAGDRVQ